MVLNYIWNWNFSEVVISTPKVGSVNLPAQGLIQGLEEESVHFPNLYIVPLLN